MCSPAWHAALTDPLTVIVGLVILLLLVAIGRNNRD